jgi:EAL domain-containing protein (putative c-di-GMP-specific phosphodiesterase class I)
VIQLIRDDIVLTVQDALESTGLMPSNLTLEVTEGLAVQDMEAMNRILAELKKMGVRVALDDFGTGYSSLSYMRDMPLDTIKIDKSFIDDVGQDDFSDAFVKTVSSLAEAIDVDVVVEGVEDQKQTEALREMKVDLIQGYYYDKPLPQDKFEEKYCIETPYKL